MTKQELIKHIHDILDMQKVVMMEHHGRPDCKNCSLAETIQELLDEQPKISNCCSASVSDPSGEGIEGRCKDCGEHCEMEEV